MATNNSTAPPRDEKPVVVVLGACVTDLIAYTDRFPNPGETVVGNGFVICYGGKGANTAVMLLKLGCHTSLISKIGIDDFGKSFKGYLKTIGMNIDGLKEDSMLPTSASIITVDGKGENNIVYNPGAVGALSVAEVESSESLFQSAKVFLSVFETPMPNVVAGLNLAKKHGLITYVNAAPLVKEHLPESALTLIDYICINETEGTHLCYGIGGIRTIKKLESQEIADYLLSKGVKNVLITMGSKGAAFASQETPKLEIVPIPEKVNVVDTTGAGDAFNGGFVYQLVRNSHLTLREKVRKASGIAGLTVGSKGTTSSYPELSAVPSQYL